MCMCKHTCQHTCRGQRSTFRNQFFLPQRSKGPNSDPPSGWAASDIYALTYLTHPRVNFSKKKKQLKAK